MSEGSTEIIESSNSHEILMVLGRCSPTPPDVADGEETLDAILADAPAPPNESEAAREAREAKNRSRAVRRMRAQQRVEEVE